MAELAITRQILRKADLLFLTKRQSSSMQPQEHLPALNTDLEETSSHLQNIQVYYAHEPLVTQLSGDTCQSLF